MACRRVYLDLNLVYLCMLVVIQRSATDRIHDVIDITTLCNQVPYKETSEGESCNPATLWIPDSKSK